MVSTCVGVEWGSSVPHRPSGTQADGGSVGFTLGIDLESPEKRRERVEKAQQYLNHLRPEGPHITSVYSPTGRTQWPRVDAGDSGKCGRWLGSHLQSRVHVIDDGEGIPR